MANSFSIDVNLTRFNDELDKEYQAIIAEMDAEYQAAASNIEAAAVIAAPVSNKMERNEKASGPTAGGLKSIIQAKRLDRLDYEVVAPIKYAPYVEFGTGENVSIPPGFEELAQTFYVDGKGRNKAQPFLIPAFLFESQQLLKRLEAIK
jgi:hypothetical protein